MRQLAPTEGKTMRLNTLDAYPRERSARAGTAVVTYRSHGPYVTGQSSSCTVRCLVAAKA